MIESVQIIISDKNELESRQLDGAIRFIRPFRTGPKRTRILNFLLILSRNDCLGSMFPTRFSQLNRGLARFAATPESEPHRTPFARLPVLGPAESSYFHFILLAPGAAFLRRGASPRAKDTRIPCGDCSRRRPTNRRPRKDNKHRVNSLGNAVGRLDADVLRAARARLGVGDAAPVPVAAAQAQDACCRSPQDAEKRAAHTRTAREPKEPKEPALDAGTRWSRRQAQKWRGPRSLDARQIKERQKDI